MTLAFNLRCFEQELRGSINSGGTEGMFTFRTALNAFTTDIENSNNLQKATKTLMRQQQNLH